MAGNENGRPGQPQQSAPQGQPQAAPQNGSQSYGVSEIALRRIDTPQPHYGGDTVVVGCKLPMGLILQVCEKRTRQEAVIGGGVRDYDIYERVPPSDGGADWFVHGSAHPQNEAPRWEIVGGYALTPGIPKDHWEAWHRQNKMSDLVRKGVIFAERSVERARDAAKSGAMVVSGLERIDPNAIPENLAQPSSKHLSGISKDKGPAALGGMMRTGG